MAVGPGGVLALRRPGWVEEALLNQQHVGPFRVFAAPHRPFRGGDLFQAAPQVRCRCACHLWVLPWDRPGKGVIDLENAGPVAESLQLANDQEARRQHKPQHRPAPHPPTRCLVDRDIRQRHGEGSRIDQNREIAAAAMRFIPDVAWYCLSEWSPPVIKPPSSPTARSPAGCRWGASAIRNGDRR